MAGQRPDGLPLTVAGVGAVIVVACFGATVFGLLSATISRKPANLPPVPPAAAAEEKPAQALSAEQVATLLHREIEAQEREFANADRILLETRARVSSLDARRAELQAAVQQRRGDVAAAEDTARRAEAREKEAAERRRRLQEEAAQLEKRITELNASIAETERQALARAARESSGPQLVECVS